MVLFGHGLQIVGTGSRDRTRDAIAELGQAVQVSLLFVRIYPGLHCLHLLKRNKDFVD